MRGPQDKAFWFEFDFHDIPLECEAVGSFDDDHVCVTAVRIADRHGEERYIDYERMPAVVDHEPVKACGATLYHQPVYGTLENLLNKKACEIWEREERLVRHA